MDKNKLTTMQELWSYVKDDKTIPFEHYRKLRDKILPLIEKENRQITDAYNQGKHNANCGGYDLTAEQYYKETYEK